MFWDHDLRRRFRRRMRAPFSAESFFDDIDRMMQEMLREATETAPRELTRERKLPDGSTVREIGPIVYGYSMKVGPDGKPVVREFGNLKPSRPRGIGLRGPKIEVIDKREPLVDVIDEGDGVKVVSELPGVDKSDIRLSCDGRTLTISVDTADRKYFKEERLGADVDPDSAKASFKNGVLEVNFRKTSPSARGRPLKIE